MVHFNIYKNIRNINYCNVMQKESDREREKGKKKCRVSPFEYSKWY